MWWRISLLVRRWVQKAVTPDLVIAVGHKPRYALGEQTFLSCCGSMHMQHSIHGSMDDSLSYTLGQNMSLGIRIFMDSQAALQALENPNGCPAPQRKLRNS